MSNRRYEIITNRGTLDTTNSLQHALRLLAGKRCFAMLADNRPDPKYRWLKQDILEAKH